MSSVWRGRVALTTVCWLLLCVLMAALHLAPRPVLFAGIAMVVLAVAGLVLDISDVAEPVRWDSLHEAEPMRRGADMRLRALQGQLLHGHGLDDGRALHNMLVDLTDERLLSVHGIDRSADPERAAALMAPGLAAFVRDVPTAKQLGDARYLGAIIGQIETL